MPDPRAPTAPGPAAPPEPEEREAIVYLPGLLHDEEMQGAAQIGLHVAEALDQTAESGAATFAVTDVRTERIAGAEVRSVSVLRSDGGEERAVVDVFDLDYRPTLLGGFAERAPIRQAAVVLGRSLLFGTRFVAAAGRPGQRASHRTQLFIGMVLLAVVLAYTLVVVLAAVGTAADRAVPDERRPAAASVARPPAMSATTASAREARAAAPERRPGRLSRLWAGVEPVVAWLQVVVVGGAFAGLLTRRSVKEILEQAGVELSATGAYLDHAAQRELVVGAVARLLNRLEEREAEGVRYTAVHLVGYSFGSVVALDALFHPAHVGPRFRRVRSLVTIGCPFDFVRTYWPDYFRGRSALAEVPARWINVVSPADVFGSRFADPEREDGVAGVEMREGPTRTPDAEVVFGPSLPEGGWSRPFRVALFLLAGRSFRAHRAYWEAGAVTAWEPVVQRVFAGRALLG